MTKKSSKKSSVRAKRKTKKSAINRKIPKKNIIQEKILSSIGLMTGHIIHEINNPITAMKVHAELLQALIQTENLDKDSLQNTADSINSAIDRVINIISAVKNLSHKNSADTIEAHTLERILRTTLGFIESELRKNDIQFSQSHENPDIMIKCNLTELSQVILNLINNSIHAIKDSSKKWINISSKIYSNYIEIKVTDCGAGISKNIQKKLFTPHFTTKDIGVGTGIGLNLSRQIMKKLNGSISYESSPDSKNTTFVIKIPRA